MERADSVHSHVSEATKYYRRSLAGGDDQGTFRNLDSSAVLHESLQALSSSSSENFLLDFSDEHAWIGFDLSTQSIIELLKAEVRPDQLNTRWINLWYPFRHKSLLEALGKQYDFSPRLLAMMCSDPSKLVRSSSRTQRSTPSRTSLQRTDQSSSSDIERGEGSSDIASVTSNNPARTGNIYDIAEEVWHYTSVDQGRNYFCIGYNSIYNTGTIDLSKEQRSGASKPPLSHCKRVWTWLLLCSNRTIITINEDPFPCAEGHLSHQEYQVLMDTRRNMTNVFKSLSCVKEPASDSPLTLLPIRKRLGNTEEENVHRSSDTPGLLFYYLFENWFNSYSLVTRRDSRYGVELENIRNEMFKKPQLGIIDRLDKVGNQLSVLKRHYKSYIRIIERVTEPSTATIASLSNSQIISSRASEEALSQGQNPINPQMTEATTMMGVSLSQASLVRFERLKDIINLYALSEVKDYLHEKDSLVQMNFQLIAIKESLDVERLTRVSLLITKVTILFLPVSLMTAYFSTQLVNQEYTVTTYWIAFAGVFVLSFIALLGFGVMSGSMQSWMLVKPMRRIMSRVMGKRM